MFAQTEDQQLFEDATRRFLGAHYPVDRVRALAGAQRVFDPALWRQAANLGWTSLLVPETAGGGSISGNGLADLLIIAYHFGQHAAPGPLLGTNMVAAAIGRWGTADQQSGPLAEILAGDAVGAWVPAGAKPDRVTATVAGEKVVLDGRVTGVESAADARYLLVTATEAAGDTHFLVPVAAPGVDVVPLAGIDLTRRFHDVALRDVLLPLDARVGQPGVARAHDADLLDFRTVITLGEIVGTVDRALAMTLDWAANRYSFGRPLGSYQEIKHRLADMRTHLEAAEAIASRAAFSVGTGAPDARSWVSAGAAYVGRHGPEVIQDCVQMHGGIGVTYDHDLHLFLRRATLDAHLFGSPSDFARRLGALVAAEMVAEEGAIQ